MDKRNNREHNERSMNIQEVFSVFIKKYLDLLCGKITEEVLLIFLQKYNSHLTLDNLKDIQNHPIKLFVILLDNLEIPEHEKNAVFELVNIIFNKDLSVEEKEVELHKHVSNLEYYILLIWGVQNKKNYNDIAKINEEITGTRIKFKNLLLTDISKLTTNRDRGEKSYNFSITKYKLEMTLSNKKVPSTKEEIQQQLLHTLNQGKDNVPVAVALMLDIIKPHFIKRIASLDFTNLQEIQKQYEEIIYDISLLRNFYESMKDYISLHESGETNINPQEMADKLAQVGPMLIKLMQRRGPKMLDLSTGSTKVQYDSDILFSKRIGRKWISLERTSIKEKKTSKSPENLGDKKNFIMDLNSILKEGVSPVTQEEIDQTLQNYYPNGIPKGLEIERGEGNLLKTGSVAFVLRGKYNGKSVVLKIKRLGIEEKSKENLHVFKTLIKVFSDFKNHYTGENKDIEATQLQKLGNIASFFWDFLEKTFQSNFDFADEMDALDEQYELHDVNKVAIPKVYREISHDEGLIAMDYLNFVDQERFKGDVENTLRNFFSFLIKNVEIGKHHGDPHSKNLGITVDKRLAVFDYGEYPNVAKERFWELVGLAIAIKRGKVKKITEYIYKLQDNVHTDGELVSMDEIKIIVNEAIQKYTSKSGSLSIETMMKVSQEIIMQIAFEKGQTINSEMVNLMTSFYSYEDFLDKELEKKFGPNENRGREKMLYSMKEWKYLYKQFLGAYNENKGQKSNFISLVRENINLIKEHIFYF